MKQSLRSDEVYGLRMLVFTVGGEELLRFTLIPWVMPIFKRQIQMEKSRVTSVTWDGLQLFILQKTTFTKPGWWYINQQQRKSEHPSVSLLWLAKVSPALFHALPLVTHYRLLCQRMPGGLRPCVFTCGADKARLCASSPGAPQSCWPGPPQPKPPPASAQAPQFPLHSLCPLSCD